MCYHFNFNNYCSRKEILYSVLTSTPSKLLIPISQIVISEKPLKNAKKATPQKERTIDDLLTRSRVLLLKSQLSLQKKTIPEPICELATSLKEAATKKRRRNA